MISWFLLVPLGFRRLSPFLSPFLSLLSLLSLFRKRILFHHDFLVPPGSGSGSGPCLPSCLASCLSSCLFSLLKNRSLFHHDFLVPSGSGACLPLVSRLVSFFFLKWFCRRSARPADIHSAKAAEATEFTIIQIPTVTWKHGLLMFGVYAGVINCLICHDSNKDVVWTPVRSANPWPRKCLRAAPISNALCEYVLGSFLTQYTFVVVCIPAVQQHQKLPCRKKLCVYRLWQMFVQNHNPLLP